MRAMKAEQFSGYGGAKARRRSEANRLDRRHHQRGDQVKGLSS